MPSDIVLEFNRRQAESFNLSYLRDYASRANDNDPIIRENTTAFLRFLVGIKKPERILEAGTSIGYSSLVIAKTLRELNLDFRIDTVEINEETFNKARSNFIKEGFAESKIHPILGDSVEVFNCIEGRYDVIFLDSSKSHYIDMLDDCKRLLNKGGLLVCDDVVFYGKALETPENSPHKHRTIVANLREFIERIGNDKDFTAFLDPLDDGVLVAVYNGD